jgi:GT2 family glycosyltransferase
MEIIVSDNDSNDGSVEMIKQKFQWVKLIQGPNIGFSNGNNRARKYVRGKYILFLNSDTLVYKDVFSKTIRYFDNHSDIGALTCKLVLENGTLDKDARRKFPTPWTSLKRLFLNSGNNYWYNNIDENRIHEVEAIQGAFFLTTKEILDKVGWFDEGYQWAGEDLDLSFQISQLGLKIIYYPKVKLLHLKGASMGKIKRTSRNVDPKVKLARVMQGVDSMEYFYRKNMWSKYPVVLNYVVLLGISLLRFARLVKFKVNN